MWPEHLPLTARFGVIEFDGRDEETLQEAINLLKDMKASGLDMVNVSMGFSTPEAKIPWAPAFLAPYAERVSRETGLPVASSWGIEKAEDAEHVVANKQMDLVMIGRAYLADPHWTYHVARKLGVEKPSWTLPAPYAHWLERYSLSE